MKILNAVTAGLVLAATPLLAQADGMNYSYVGLDYVETEIDGLGPTADGFGLRGSIGFAEDFFAFVDYADLSVSGIDLESYSVGLGARYALSGNLDLVGRGGWTKVDVSGPGGSFDDDGYIVSAGARGRVGENVEFEGSVIYTDFGGGSSGDTAISVGGRYHFNENFAIGAEYRDSDDASSILAGVRFSF